MGRLRNQELRFEYLISLHDVCKTHLIFHYASCTNFECSGRVRLGGSARWTSARSRVTSHAVSLHLCMAVCGHKGWYHHASSIRRQNEWPRSHATCEYNKKCHYYIQGYTETKTLLKRTDWSPINMFDEMSAHLKVQYSCARYSILSCVWFTRVGCEIKSSVLNILSLHVVFAIDILMLYVTVVFEFAWVGCETRSSDLNI